MTPICVSGHLYSVIKSGDCRVCRAILKYSQKQIQKTKCSRDLMTEYK